MSETTIHQAYVAALAALQNPRKNQTAATGKFSYQYADLATVLDLVRPVFAAHGLAISQDVQSHDGVLTVLTYVMHTSGEVLTFGPITGRAGADWQALGSAVTYCRRYSLMAACGLAAEDEDDDGTATKGAYTSPQPVPQPQPMDDPWLRPAEAVAEELLGAEKVTMVEIPGGLHGPAARAYAKNAASAPSEKQLGFLRKLVMEEAGHSGHDPLVIVNAYLSDMDWPEVSSTSDLTKQQASKIIGAIQTHLATRTDDPSVSGDI